MSELISREALHNAIYEAECLHCIEDDDCVLCSLTPIWECIDKAPTIEAKPVVRGDWDMTNADDDFVSGIGCSVCGHMIISLGKYNWRKTAKDWNFCPNCGADMRGETDD